MTYVNHELEAEKAEYKRDCQRLTEMLDRRFAADSRYWEGKEYWENLQRKADSALEQHINPKES